MSLTREAPGQTPEHYFEAKLIITASPLVGKLVNTLDFGVTHSPTALTAWHRMGYLVRLMPPANTEKVSAAWKQKFRSACRPFWLIRMALREQRCRVRNRPFWAKPARPQPRGYP